MTPCLRHALRCARWWVLDYGYAVARQVQVLLPHPAPDAFVPGHRRPVVVVPGVYETWTFMLPLVRSLHGQGHPVHVVTGLGWNVRSIERSAQLVADLVAERDLHDAVVVAHSKGGLIGKVAMLRHDPSCRIASMVAVCTPFSGSRYARFALTPILRVFSPDDPRTLALTADRSVNDRITSVYGVFDPNIPEGSELPGGRNVQLETGGHFRILADPRTTAIAVAAAA